MTKADDEERWLTRSLDPGNPKDRGLIEWLAETTLLGGFSSLGAKWPKPRLFGATKTNAKREEAQRDRSDS